MLKQKEQYLDMIETAEKENHEKVQSDSHRLAFHLMPPVGWLNDPNGLCQINGTYHVFFQYSPLDAKGGEKFWGHYTSTDMIHWDYVGVPLCPDHMADRNGVYSGSALVDDGKMCLFYTGNVKEHGNYDYIHDGRGANQILVTSEDGIHMSEKLVVLNCEDYPNAYTCHIRDPKVWKEHDTYYMVLGGRKMMDPDRTDGTEYGAVLLYKSENLTDWEYDRDITSDKPFGYMWECPDYLVFGKHTYLSVSPQGLDREQYRYQNVYQSGYFTLKSDLHKTDVVTEQDFHEWDYGFDFYAPQTFEDESGRRILIGWMGLPDIDDEYQNPTTEYGWQHALTVPRVLAEQNDRIYQWPVEELEQLRDECTEISGKTEVTVEQGICDIVLTEIYEKSGRIIIGKGLSLNYQDGVFSMEFTDESGCGREKRQFVCTSLSELRILVDRSAVEVYVNHGEAVMTTRFYPEEKACVIQLDLENYQGTVWSMKEV